MYKSGVVNGNNITTTNGVTHYSEDDAIILTCGFIHVLTLKPQANTSKSSVIIAVIIANIVSANVPLTKVLRELITSHFICKAGKVATCKTEFKCITRCLVNGIPLVINSLSSHFSGFI